MGIQLGDEVTIRVQPSSNTFHEARRELEELHKSEMKGMNYG